MKKYKRGNAIEFMKKNVAQIFLWALIVVSLGVLATLCFDKGIDYDEAYSCMLAHDYSLAGILNYVADEHSVDVPLYYQCLHLWTKLFGSSWFMYRMFSVAGAAASMLLAATAIKRYWGYLTSYLFIIFVGFAPAMIHINVNIRTYSWQVFIMAAAAVTAYSITQRQTIRKWVCLLVLSECAYFSHYFSLFGFFMIYLYLLIWFIIKNKRQIWKVLCCGVLSVVPIIIFAFCADFFHFVESDGEKILELEINTDEALTYIFKTDIHWSVLMCFIITVTIFAAAIVMIVRKMGDRNTLCFAVFAMLTFPVCYVTAGYVSAYADHFFIARHVVNTVGLLWLGISITAPRISKKVYCSLMVFAAIMAVSSYSSEYISSHSDIQYIDATIAFINDNMEPGDVVIYNADEKYDMLYHCYMPQQQFYHITEVSDLEDFEGKRVWLFMSNQSRLAEEVTEGYEVSTEYKGHYGFQIIGNCTDFDLFYMNIEKAGEN